MPLPSTAQHGLQQDKVIGHITHIPVALQVTVHSTTACRSMLYKEPDTEAKPASFHGVFSLTSHGGKKRPAECEREMYIEQTQAQLCSKLVANNEPGPGNLGS